MKTSKVFFMLASLAAGVVLGGILFLYLQSREFVDLNEQIISLYQSGQYDQALTVAKSMLEIAEKELDPDHFFVFLSLKNLADLYGTLGQYAKAEPLLIRSLSIQEKVLGSDHFDVAESLNSLANLYNTQAQYEKAESLYMRSLSIREKILGSDHPDVATILGNLAEVYHAQGQYEKTEPLHIRSLAIREKALGSDHPDVATSLNNLATLYLEQGQHAKVEPLLMRSLAILEKAFGPEHPDVAKNLNNLAELYREQGQYEKVELLLMRSLVIYEKAFGPDHPDVGMSLNNLAALYYEERQYKKAEPLLMRSLVIYEKAFGPDHPDVARGLNNLAQLYRFQGQYAKAEQLYARGLAIYEKSLKQNHSNVATVLNNFADLYLAQGQYAKVEPLLMRSLAIREKAFGPDHPDVAMSLNNLAALYHAEGQYEKAESLLMRSLVIYEKTLGSDHPKVEFVLGNIPVILWSLGNMAEALVALQRSIAFREHLLSFFLMRSSEEEKRTYMATIATDPHLAITLQQALGPSNLAATRLALSTLLQRKGRILDAISSDVANLRERLNEQDRMFLDQLATIRNQQSSLYNQARHGKIASEVYHKELARLTAEAQKLEAKISSHSTEFKTKSQPITLAGIQQAIPKDAALVEFAVYRSFNPKAQKVDDNWGAARYIAYVLKPQGDPLSLELGDAAAIDRSISALRNALSDSKSGNDLVMFLARRLDEQLMQPVRKLLGETRTVFLSPDGALNLLPFDALVDENDQYLIGNYDFTYLSSGRDLLRLEAKIQSQDSGVIIGDVDFGEAAANRSQTPEVDSRALNRRSSDFVSEKFLPLPGTALEAQEISKILPIAKVLLGKEATEGAIKKLNSPRVLHVATHGFFLPDIKGDLQDTRTIQTMDSIVRMPVTENPLLRSGLALANANLLESSGDDGVLTALETSGLNLWGTQLVVLSACETGLGEVQNGEGVFGLRRALVIAGSESQLMTLWKVDDLATKDLMVDYYRRLVAKEGRSAALRQAQLAMLSNPDRQHPYYWASFIASGDWRQLD